MNPKTPPEHRFLLISTAEDSVIKVDIVNGLSGLRVFPSEADMFSGKRCPLDEPNGCNASCPT